MTPPTTSELIRQCCDSARDLLAAAKRHDVLDGDFRTIEEPLLEAIAALELAVALTRVDKKTDIRALPSDPLWIERKYDSQRR